MNYKQLADVYKKKYYIYKEKYLNLKENKENKDNENSNNNSNSNCNKNSNHEIFLDSYSKKFMDSLKNIRPIHKLSIIDARKTIEDIQFDESYKNMVDIEDVIISDDDGIIDPHNRNRKPDLFLKIFKPKNDNMLTSIKNKCLSPGFQLSGLPIIIYYHGGGWILGNSQTHGRLMAEICTETNSGVIYVGYTPSPEKKYPAQILQAYEALKYIYNNAVKYNLDNTRMIVMGDDVGANMATIIAMLNKERKGPKLLSQILLYPVTDSSMNTDSYHLYSDGPWLNRTAMEWFFNAYEADLDIRAIATVSPFNAANEHIKGLIDTLIITAENDILRDEGEAYAHKLMAIGVNVTAIRVLGTIHDFLMLDPLKKSPTTRYIMMLITSYIKDKFYNKYMQ